MRAWYLIYSKVHQERVARENLERQGYEAYLPLMRARRRRGGRPVKVAEPMFPRYLFIHLSDATDDWGPIRSTKGVMRLIRFGASAARVPEDFVAALREREDETGVQLLPAYRFEAGDEVLINEGIFEGYEAVFHARTGKERVMLLLDIAGKAARVVVGLDEIEPLAS